MLKLISWNVNKRKSVSDQIAVLLGRKPHVVALQEVTAYTAPLFEETLKHLGLPHVVHTFQDNPEQEPSGVLVASCYDLIRLPGELSPLPLSGQFNCPGDVVAKHWRKRTLSVALSGMWGKIDLFNVHIPPFAYKDCPKLKVDFLWAVYFTLANHTDSHRILCGDFNTPQEETSNGEIITWGCRKKHGRYVITPSFQSQHEVEFHILRGLGEHFDLPDVYRQLHGYESSGADRAFSYIGRGTQKGKFRYDHVFASKALGVKSAEYLHSFRDESKLSDHSPIEVVFELGSSLKTDEQRAT